MTTGLARSIVWVLCLAVPLLAVAPDSGDEEKKVRDAGFGISFSTGQSLFYTRATDPFRSNHVYWAVGFHQEESGIALSFFNPYTGTQQRNASQKYYLELSSGWRHLLFRESLAGGFFPHTVLELGASGYLAQEGSLGNLFAEASFRWVPILQAGVGVSIYTGIAIYRIEMGYQATVTSLPKKLFPKYQGTYLKVVYSSGQKPR